MGWPPSLALVDSADLFGSANPVLCAVGDTAPTTADLGRLGQTVCGAKVVGVFRTSGEYL